MTIINHAVTVPREIIDGKGGTVVILLEIDITRLATNLAHDVIHNQSGKVTRAGGAIVATRQPTRPTTTQQKPPNAPTVSEHECGIIPDEAVVGQYVQDGIIYSVATTVHGLKARAMSTIHARPGYVEIPDRAYETRSGRIIRAERLPN